MTDPELLLFERYLQQRRYSSNTVSAYCEVLRTFLDFIGFKNRDEITNADIERFNCDYILVRGLSASYQNQLINALKLYFEKFHGQQLDLHLIERPRSSHKLPVILSMEEVEELLNCTLNIKHRTMLGLIYSCGLRMGELLNLRIEDIDSKRMLIHIRHAKGNKDRMLPLSPSTLDLLRTYYVHYRPKVFLFNGQTGQQYSRSSLQLVFRKALLRTRIGKKCTLHTLRHSYATHLLESGINLRYIQELLGHSSPKTTMIYTHVSSGAIRNIESPIEKIKLNTG